MEKFQVIWDRVSKDLTELRAECVKYLYDILNQEKYSKGISLETDDGASVCVTYDGGSHPERYTNAYSTVKGVYMKNHDVMLDTEDDDEYCITRIGTIELLGVCDFVEAVTRK